MMTSVRYDVRRALQLPGAQNKIDPSKKITFRFDQFWKQTTKGDQLSFQYQMILKKKKCHFICYYEPHLFPQTPCSMFNSIANTAIITATITAIITTDTTATTTAITTAITTTITTTVRSIINIILPDPNFWIHKQF